MDHQVLETDRHRYAIVSWLADGGMGALYRGRRIGAGVETEVVLKQLLPEHTADPKLIELFLREARLSASLSHKNIVKTLDLVNAGDDYFIVMEYVHGGDLRTIVRRARRRQAALSIDSCVFVVAEVLAALAYAHDKRGRDGQVLGLIHRDVSPSNVLLGDRGEVKLTDFGIAKSPSQGSVVFKVKGKVGYMAPEQARGEPVDRRVDLFAAGVVLYELLVGERLFVGNALSPASVLFAQPVKPPSRRRPELDAELDAVVMRALALDREQRFATASEMRDALLGTIRGRAPSERTLLDDLRRACGEDPSLWRNLDVAPQATLDGAPSEGTGVIVTGDEDDDEAVERSLSRSVRLPTRELTSVVRLRSASNLGEPPTQLSEDPFAPTANVNMPPASARRDHHQDDAEDAPNDFDEAQTRVAPGPGFTARPAPPPAPTRTTGPRATFEPPVPRALVLPPDSIEQDARGLVPFRDAPTRLSSSQPLPIVPPSPPPAATPDTPTRSTPMPSRPPDSRSHSVPIAILDKALRGHTTTRLVLTIVGLIVLIAIGVVLGVVLSGERPS